MAPDQSAGDEFGNETGQVETAPDILDLLRRDHQAAQELLGRFESPAGARDEWFDTVRETLVRHEVAEELVVYPAVRHTGEPGREVLEERLAEQAAATKMLSELETMELGSAEFKEAFLRLRSAVLDHAREEEDTVFPAFDSTKLDRERRFLGERYERAKHAAPSRPHPHLPQTPPGNVVLGPVAAFADRLRDAARNDDDQSHLSRTE